MTWDGIDRNPPEWNRDLNLKEAMKLSAVWFYQVLARRVGHEQMQKWVTQVGYGNHQIVATKEIDNFWLRGQLRITHQAQIQFLRRLYNGDLPFSKRRSRSSRISQSSNKLQTIPFVEKQVLPDLMRVSNHKLAGMWGI